MASKTLTGLARLLRPLMPFRLPSCPRIDPRLQTLITACPDTRTLTALLCSLDGKDEAVMEAFDRRLEELEREGK